MCVIWKPRVEHVRSCVQQISPFSCFGSAPETGRDILAGATSVRHGFDDLRSTLFRVTTGSAASSGGRLLDGSAHHTASKCSNNELLRTFFDAQKCL